VENSSPPNEASSSLGPEPRVFLARRSPEAGHGGLWELPGGKVEKGERPEAALIREIHEELGVGLRLEGPPLRYRSSIGGRDFLFLVYPSRFESGAFELAAHDDWRYFGADELEGLPLAPLDAPALIDWSRRGLGA
jgi:8-oxo-dGTP diphosphatase